MIPRLRALLTPIRSSPTQFHRTFSSTLPTRSSSPSEQDEQPFAPAEQGGHQPIKKTLLSDLPKTVLNDYHETQCPNEAQLAYADKLFAPSRHSPIKLWSASKFRTTPMSSQEPEVCFLGRSNVGKSSVLNRLMGEEICYTSSKPGRTREMNAFGIGGTKGGESKIVLLDMPGYGHGGRWDWGVEIMKYLKQRKQLRRVFVLIDGFHGLKRWDIEVLKLLSQYGIPYQIVVAKIDKLLAKQPAQIRTGVTEKGFETVRDVHRQLRIGARGALQFWKGPPPLGETLTCCSKVERTQGEYIGISALRWAVVKAAGYDANLDADGKVIKRSASLASPPPPPPSPQVQPSGELTPPPSPQVQQQPEKVVEVVDDEMVEEAEREVEEAEEEVNEWFTNPDDPAPTKKNKKRKSRI
ncbi:translation initiation/elongation factor MRX8 [Aspergillus homomorphus CBS 101889]|uniref:GTP-binding protein 8 n=1 Tax=Aspergillus homomorphus (strain CBS 101889) TaxID=1450537 RepID=A0A395HTY6_ASPHC|nr:hypothetical protein BO97DRAFT_445364 [Aspergillus homomorphus CBS 101889]RAL09674.1 hypothetical protein BO97DRAFT_445364 [Aspergillus homomorphus CBS 101889]